MEASYTVAEGADDTTRVAAIRAALTALASHLGHLAIDVVSDQPWPGEVTWAVDAARERIGNRRFRSPDTFRADPRDDESVAVAVALAPYTIGGSGLDVRGHLIWSADDTGTSAAFRLSEAQAEAVRAAISDDGGDPSMLIPIA
ncbi:DNA/RNA non-specific endonuclease [Nocardioides nematodiphilus]|uniref:DNA/RNA non-specific endonuclease n=1 Tax=Nocardioides nematodiphilus TaxID=2849669 RepID=UPI001CD99E89|nr:DNA/RNA non-specific endonuclease [Nocardioides nematodiphilus]MCA1981649.1 DNA/RNA non-specific endonuclease [Nocardioides nematodiphilus]